jgi:hypothetical protein
VLKPNKSTGLDDGVDGSHQRQSLDSPAAGAELSDCSAVQVPIGPSKCNANDVTLSLDKRLNQNSYSGYDSIDYSAGESTTAVAHSDYDNVYDNDVDVKPAVKEDVYEEMEEIMEKVSSLNSQTKL